MSGYILYTEFDLLFIIYLMSESVCFKKSSSFGIRIKESDAVNYLKRPRQYGKGNGDCICNAVTFYFSLRFK